MENNNRLNAKDLINVGIYTAICAVICCAIAMTGVIPIMMVLLVVFVPIFTGMQEFVKKLKNMGYAEVELVDTTNGMFMSRWESTWMGLSGSAVLMGRK